MVDAFTELNPGLGGSKMDEDEVIVDGIPVRRTRLRVAGADPAALAGVLNGTPPSTAYGLVARVMGATHERDTLNEQPSVLPPGGQFIGTYSRVADHASFLLLYASFQTFTGLIRWSPDGVNSDPSIFGVTPLVVKVDPPSGYSYVIYLGNTPLNDYYRLEITNGGTQQTAGVLALAVKSPVAITGTAGFLSDSLTINSVVQLVRSVTAGLTPDGTFVNEAIQGRHTANCTTTPLDANAVYRGTWFEWQTNYVKAVVDVHADVAGTLYIDYSEDAVPVDGDESSVDASTVLAYVVSDGLLRRQTPVQSRWVRMRYVNGVAAQADFELDTSFLTSDSGIAVQQLTRLPLRQELGGVVRAVPALPTGDGTGYQEVPVDTGGVPTSHVTGFDPDVLLRPLPSGRTSQKTVGALTPTRLDPIPLANRRAVAIANMEATNGAVIGFSSALTVATGFDLPAGRAIPFDVSTAVQLWAISKAAGGSTNIQTRAGTTNAGTATNTTNAKVLDGIYSDIIAAAQFIDIGGYSITPTLTNFVTIRLGVVGHKQANVTQTVLPVETQTGNAGNVGTIATTNPISGGTAMAYLASVSREKGNAAVTSVTGLGLTWTLVDTGVQGTTRAVDVWLAFGSATSSTVTASFSALATNSHISVTRFTGVSQSTPVQDHLSATGNSATPATGAINGTQNGIVYVAGCVDNNTPSPAGTWTALSNEVTLAGSSRDGLGAEYKSLAGTGAVTPTMVSSGSVQWGAVGVTLTPAPAIDPTFTLSYQLSAVTGATTQSITYANTTDSTTYLDVTGDRAWAFTDIPNVHVFATATIVGDAAIEIDQLFLEITESSAATCRISLMELA